MTGPEVNEGKFLGQGLGKGKGKVTRSWINASNIRPQREKSEALLHITVAPPGPLWVKLAVLLLSILVHGPTLEAK